MSLKNKFKQKIQLYGLRGTIQRAFKRIIYVLFRFKWEKCYLMSRTLDSVCLPSSNADMEIREIRMEDYETDLWKDFFTEEKKQIYQERFRNKNAKSYGVFINGFLACSAWILYKTVILSEKKTLFEDETSALLFDAYTHPQFRGRGFHNYVNQWRLNEMKRKGIKKAYTVVLAYNVPSIKTQEKCGLRIEQIFYAYSLGNKVYINKKFNKYNN